MIILDEADLQEIGKRIQNRRKQQGYTQEQLAEEMNVSIQMISNLERGNKAIRIDNLIKLSRILKISTDYILTGVQPNGDADLLSAQISKLPERDKRILALLVECCINT